MIKKKNYDVGHTIQIRGFFIMIIVNRYSYLCAGQAVYLHWLYYLLFKLLFTFGSLLWKGGKYEICLAMKFRIIFPVLKTHN